MKRLKKFITPQVVKWFVVGVGFSAFGVLVLKLMVGIMGWPYMISTLVSGEIGTVLRFLVVDRWVFAHRRPTWKRLWQYHLANALGFAVWWSAANLLEASGIHYLLAPILAIFFSIGFSLATNFLWVWRKPAAQNPAG